ncbi:MAG: hypothetical protein PVF58_12310 [Candidatus Methanofastidiosia archaeon]|jgi:hypothetical protein
MPRIEIYLNEADKMRRKGEFEKAVEWLGRHLEEHEYSKKSKKDVFWRLRDISERQMENREFLQALNHYDSYLSLAESLLPFNEYKSAVFFAIKKCKWIIDVQTSSNSFDIARKYFSRIINYGRRLDDTEVVDEILSYIVGKYIKEMERSVSAPPLLKKLKEETDTYIGMIKDSGLRDRLKNKKVVHDDDTQLY